MRFYNGVKASNRGLTLPISLSPVICLRPEVCLAKTPTTAGSTGGIKSIDKQATGLRVRQDAASRQADARKVFDQEGIGRFGANKEAWIARQYEDDKRKAMEDKQFGREED